MTKNNFDTFYNVIKNDYKSIGCFEGRMDTLKDLLEDEVNEVNYIDKLKSVLDLYEKRIKFLEDIKDVR